MGRSSQAGVLKLAGQVLDISKHESTVRVTPSVLVGHRARVYRFPSKTPNVPPRPLPASKRKRLSNFRIHLAVEITIGLFFWLVWFVLHLFR